MVTICEDVEQVWGEGMASPLHVPASRENAPSLNEWQRKGAPLNPSP